MLSLSLALALKEAGLVWVPKLHDFFALPGTSLENRLFVVSDMMIDVQQLIGQQMITFNGAVEWSLDYITITDAVWIPTEDQLRNELWHRLQAETSSSVELSSSPGSHNCSVLFKGTSVSFGAFTASDAYAKALLYILSEIREHFPDV